MKGFYLVLVPYIFICDLAGVLLAALDFLLCASVNLTFSWVWCYLYQPTVGLFRLNCTPILCETGTTLFFICQQNQNSIIRSKTVPVAKRKGVIDYIVMSSCRFLLFFEWPVPYPRSKEQSQKLNVSEWHSRHDSDPAFDGFSILRSSHSIICEGQLAAT